MRRIVTVLTILWITSLFLISVVFAQDRFDIDLLDEYDYVENQVIIKFREDASLQDVTSIQQSLNASLLQTFRYLTAEVWEISGIGVREAILQYRDHPAVEYIEPNLIIPLDLPSEERESFDLESLFNNLDDQIIPNDPLFGQQWHYLNTGQTGGTPGADIDVTRAWTIETGDTILIAIVDTGIDYNHPDIAGNMWSGIGINTIAPGNPPMDGHGHGTHVAGTVAAMTDNEIGVAGVSWVARLMAVKIFSDWGSTTTTAIVNGVEYTVTENAQISNHSWGGPYEQVIFDAFELTHQAGQLVVAAAGNHASSNDDNPRYPAAYDLDNILAVAASNHNDVKAGYSAWGPTTVHLAAPGGDASAAVISTLPNNSYGGTGWYGTSMASPHAAGAAALVWSKFPHYNYQQVKNQLMITVDPLPHWQNSFPVISGGRLNAYNALQEPDTVAPAPITDLAATEVLPFSIELEWTATGASGDTGTATQYDLRYSTEPITEENFSDATQVPNVPPPAPAGETEVFNVTGLTHSTTYYFAIKARDLWLNWSDMSNVVTATTQGAPQIVIDPEEFNIEMDVNEELTETLNISNPGEGTLLFSFPGAAAIETLSDPAVAKNDATHRYSPVELAKGEEDRRQGNPVILGMGGPDDFGHIWIDSNEPGGPSFTWFDISAIGDEVTAITGTWDGNAMIDLPFDFPFYGNEYDEARVSVNGWITFNTDFTGGAFTNREIPSTADPSNLLAILWDDLDMRTTGKVYTYYDSPNDRFIVQWHEVPKTGAAGSLFTFQAILYSSGMINYQYQELIGNTAANTVGIENADGTDGLQVVFNSSYLEDELSVLFIPPFPEWLSVDPASGSVVENGEVDVDVIFNSTDLVVGLYETFIAVSSNDPDNSLISIPVSMIVEGGEPELVVTPDALDFGSIIEGEQKSETLMLTNDGLAFLHVTELSVDDAAFSFSGDTSFTIAPFASREMIVTFSPPIEGVYTGSLTIESNDPVNSTLNVNLSGAAGPAPVIVVTPDELEADLLTGETEIQILTIANDGGSDLHFDLSIGSPAISALRTLHPGAEDAVWVGRLAKSRFGDRMNDISESERLEFERMVLDGRDEVRESATRSKEDVLIALYNDDVEVLLFEDFDGPFPPEGWQLTKDGVPVGDDDSNWERSNTNLAGGEMPEARFYWLPSTTALQRMITPALNTGGLTEIVVQFKHYIDHYTATYDLMLQTSADGGDTWMTVETWPAADMPATLEEITLGTEHGVGSSEFHVAWVFDGYSWDINWWNIDDVLIYHEMLWLSVEPMSGTVPPSGSMELDVTFDAAGLLGGAYMADILVASNDPATPVVAVPATLNVTGAPVLSVEPDDIDFGDVYINFDATMIVTVTNVGTDLLDVTDITSDNPLFSVDVTDFSLGPGASQEVGVTFAPTAVGSYTGSLTITSNDAASPHTVSLAGAGVPPPVMVITPDELVSDLLTGESETQNLTIDNQGEGGLDFVISVVGTTESVPASIRVRSVDRSGVVASSKDPVISDIQVDRVGGAVFSDLQKGEIDTRVGNPQLDASGGPDAFGYRWVDSNSPGGPEFEWVDIRPLGATPLTLGDDQNVGPFPIGFDFNFYDNTYNSIRICSNGFLSFTSTSTAFTNTPIPSTAEPNNALYPLWDDLHPAQGGTQDTVYYYADTENQRFIVQYQNYRRIAAPQSSMTFQVILYASGSIVYQYKELIGPLESATVGIENATGTDGLQVVFNAPYLEDELAIQFDLWLTVDPLAGTVPGNSSVNIEVTFDATGMVGGEYTADIVVMSNDPANPEVIVPATMNVTGVPLVGIQPDEIDFGEVFIDYDHTMTTIVTNVGTDVLEVSDITIDHADFSVDPTNFNLEIGETQVVEVTFAPTSVGPVTATMTIESNAPDSPHTVSLEGEGLVAPEVAVAPDSFTESVDVGSMIERTLTISNLGGSDLNFTLGAQPAEPPAAAGMTPQMRVEIQQRVEGSQAQQPRSSSIAAESRDHHIGLDAVPAAGKSSVGVFDMPDILYDNGPIINSPGTGPGGADESILQNTTLGMNILGFGHALSAGIRVADDFTVESAGGWDVEGFVFFGYQTGSPTTSTFNHVNYRIWDGPPNDPASNVIYGDVTTNRLEHTEWANIYRNTQTAQNTQRPVMVVVAGADVHLGPGTYWLDWQTGGTLASGPWVPPITINGVSNTGDGLQWIPANNAWTPLIDTDGTNDPQGLPFLVLGNSLTWITFDPDEGTVGAGDDMDITVTFDASELEMGTYYASIVVNSNDPVTPQVLIPVELTVGEMEVPDPVVLLYPEDGSTLEVEMGQEVTFEWYPSQPQVTNYKLEIALDADFTEMVYLNDEIADTFMVMVVDDDDIDGTYYWRVSAENQAGWGNPSDVWSFTVILVGVGDMDIPTVYSLMQNYPNPFNPSTTIRYGLPERSTVRIEIYNTLGQRVTTLVNEQLEAGYHDVEWYSGRAASGMYFYRLEATSVDNPANRFVEVRSMILLK